MVDVQLERGVKQGDPLSPLLFNLVIEPLISRVQSETHGLDIEGNNLSVLAFADDMVLVVYTVSRESLTVGVFT